MQIYYALLEEMGSRMMHNDCFITETKCMGPCAAGTAMVVYPDGVWYSVQSPEAAREIFQSHILGGEPLDRYRMPHEALVLLG
jgi:(2Fe-2S) ferredoxin